MNLRFCFFVDAAAMIACPNLLVAILYGVLKGKAVAILLSSAIYPQRLFCRELFVIGQFK